MDEQTNLRNHWIWIASYKALQVLGLVYVAYIMCFAGMCTPEKKDDLPPIFEGGDITNPHSLKHVPRIRAARRAITPQAQDILDDVLAEYRTYAGLEGWKTAAKNCLPWKGDFEKIERLTLFPRDLVAGMALHESFGCHMEAKDWAGGRGFMQLTSIQPERHIRPVAKMLHLEMKDVKYHEDPFHNLLVGVMVMDDYERQLQSRSHGLLAYNMGLGGVRTTARKTGWTGGATPLPSVHELRPKLAFTKKMKPRVYVPRVLACAVIMRRLYQNLGLEPLDRLNPQDIPGWDPAQDGVQFDGILR